MLMAASTASGVCILENAAREPEITDLCRMLIARGAEIEGVGTDRLTIHGKPRLHGATYAVMPDRIEAGSYACAAAITGVDRNLPLMATSAPLAISSCATAPRLYVIAQCNAV